MQIIILSEQFGNILTNLNTKVALNKDYPVLKPRRQ